MKFMVTMNMPNYRQDGIVHQLIVEHPSEDCEEFCEVLSDAPFVLVRQLYFDDDRRTGERVWVDRGDMIINCAHIGKIMPHYAPPTITVPNKSFSTLSLTKREDGQ